MKHFHTAAITAMFLAVAPMWPGSAAAGGESARRPTTTEPKPEEPAEEEVPEGVSDEDRVSGHKPPPLTRSPRKPGEFGLRDDLTREEYTNLPLPPQAYLGAKILKMEPEFVAGIQSGLELLYRRKYNGARDHFATLEEQFPKTGIRAVADTLVWQALMLENFDYRYDKQYWTSSKQARNDLEGALKLPGNEAWEHLLMATILGVESIHTMRQGGYLNALQLAFQAMDNIERSRKAAPDFIDLQIADGLYNYWRTVITMNSKLLPDFGDHRVEGIEQLQNVESGGLFVGPLATLSLAFTWMEENELKQANAAYGRNNRAYPDNIINNLVGSMVQIARRQYGDAVATLDHVFEIDSKNARAHYWKGLALLRDGKLEGAQSELETYLAGEHLEKFQRSTTHYRLGQLHVRRKDYGKAMEHFEASAKTDGNKAAKRAIDRLKERRKAKKISW